MESLNNKLLCNGKNCLEESFYTNHNIPSMTYDGLPIMQNNKILEVFYDLLEKTKPKRIIEIGTAYGGFTLMLRDLLDLVGLEDSKILTYDVNRPTDLIDKINKNNLSIEFYVHNVFDRQYNITDSNLINEIINDGKTIILCDGGNKVEEFKSLSKFVKIGDIIMAHDYSYDVDFYNEEIHNKVWYWLEIQNSDIQETCEKYNLQSFMEEDLNKVVWCCKSKII
jgi:cephalosporin hydroxylase